MAMNAYRNYNTNTKALSGNLEKLSSGYKINRAGDDAAGLAISEKMRAQITGLNAAQKNVKDGISLVKTAEGAMQEIQDMLNRMVYLAQQSANGTYDDAVDRKNLQKEVDALKSEINRIADSANFNGTKLLDGSLDSNKDLSASADFTIGGDLPKVGQTLGKDTVLHNDADGTSGTEFSVELHNFHFTADEGNTMTMKVGDTTFQLTVNDTGDGDDLTGEDLAKAILGQDARVDVKVDGKDYTAGSPISIKEQEFNVEADGGKIKFTQTKPPAGKEQEVNGSMSVTISGATAAVKGEVTLDAQALFDKIGTDIAVGDKIKVGDAEITLDGTNTANANALAAALKAAVDGATDGKFTAEVDGTDLVLTAKTAGKVSAPAISVSKAANATASAAATEAVEGADAVASSYTVDQTTDPDGGTNTTGTTADGKWNWTFNAAGGAAGTGQVSYTAVNAGAADQPPAGADNAVEGKDAVKAQYTIDLSDWDKTSKLDIGGTKYDTIADAVAAIKAAETDFDVTEADGVITLTAKVAGQVGGGTTGVPAADPTTSVSYASAASETALTGLTTVTKEGQTGGEIKGITEGANGDWNVSTTDIKNVTAEGVDRLASTYFDLTEDIASEGSQIRIGDDVYTFTSDKSKIGQVGFVDISSGDLDKIAKNLTDAAAGNAVYSVGHDGKRITVTEQTTYDNDTGNYDLRTEEGIEKSLGFTAGSTVKGTGLMLQIGDTSDKFNQLTVGIGDMHTKAMVDENGVSIADIDISTQEGAQKAVDTIKSAINYVSSVRGDLGAISNRLDHTANNLSVMRENIQDAESTIRDTDIAEEMMSYTKNNILVQSAQAMLAQANQVPQGVLQLLQ